MTNNNEIEKIVRKTVIEMNSDIINSVKENAKIVKELAEIIKQSEIERLRYEDEIYSIQKEIQALRNTLNNNGIYTVAPRANRKVNGRLGSAKLSVRDTSICVSVGAYALLNDRDYKYVQFYMTDIAHVIAMKFIKTKAEESAEITRQIQMTGALGNRMINSSFAVRSVFGTVNPGSPTRYYNVCLLEGTDDTLLAWPDTEEFCLNGHKATITDIYLISMKSDQKKVNVSNGRVRLTQGVLKMIGYTGGTLFARINTTGNQIEMIFSKKPGKDNYVLTPSKYGTGVGSMEICSVRAIKQLGYDKTTMKSMSFDVEKTVSGIKLVLNKISLR